MSLTVGYRLLFLRPGVLGVHEKDFSTWDSTVVTLLYILKPQFDCPPRLANHPRMATIFCFGNFADIKHLPPCISTNPHLHQTRLAIRPTASYMSLLAIRHALAVHFFISSSSDIISVVYQKLYNYHMSMSCYHICLTFICNKIHCGKHSFSSEHITCLDVLTMVVLSVFFHFLML